jgi:hypothetical protein
MLQMLKGSNTYALAKVLFTQIKDIVLSLLEDIAAARKGCHLAAIKKNNMKDKNTDLDRWYSKIRAPYERVFSNTSKRVRYRGIAKNQFAAFMQAICFNLKRLLVINLTSSSLRG